MPETLTNLTRLRESARHHGTDWSMVEVEPWVVVALVDLAGLAARYLETRHPDDRAQLAQTLALFRWDDAGLATDQ